MVGHPFFHRDTNAGNFSRIHPNSWSALFESRFETIDAQNSRHHFQKSLEIAVEVFFNKLDDRIGHQLAWSVKSGLTAPVNRVKFNTSLVQCRFRNAQILLAPASPKGDHPWVLHQDQAIGGRSVDPLFNQGELTLKDLVVP